MIAHQLRFTFHLLLLSHTVISILYIKVVVSQKSKALSLLFEKITIICYQFYALSLPLLEKEQFITFSLLFL